MKDIKTIIVNKNRGWRGLAEVKALDRNDKEVLKTIFSFSQDIWNDLMDGYIVLCDTTEKRYYVCTFKDADLLPRGHQRSVLIKNFVASVSSVNSYEMNGIGSAEKYSNDGIKIEKFKRNANNHTISNWNYIGLRVIPEI